MASELENHDRNDDAYDTVSDIPQPMSQPGTQQDTILEDSPSQSDSERRRSGIGSECSDDGTQVSSPRTSDGSFEDHISTLDATYQASGRPFESLAQPTIRSPFRNPSSVRAMQLDTTPPNLSTPSPRRRSKICTQTRQGTPTRSKTSRDKSPSSIFMSSPTKHLKKEHPLVLLHITILPLPQQYSIEILEAVLPVTLLTNWKLLIEKTTPTVLNRGVLVPHPREDYDLLEERLLESLELKQPRLLKCGHFHLSPEEEADIRSNDDIDEEDILDTREQCGDICGDCGRLIRDGRYGNTGTGSKRWDVKVFAANGLMRAGAWSAAWREMERVDVEIVPWMEEHLRRELDLRSEEEARHRNEEASVRKEEGIAGLDDERLREIYGGDPQAYVDGLLDEPSLLATQTPNCQKATLSPNTPGLDQKKHDIPLRDLCWRYTISKIQDPKNLFILCLSVLVAFLSIQALSLKPSPQKSVQDRVSDTGQAVGIHDRDVTRDSGSLLPDGHKTAADTLLDVSVEALQDSGSQIQTDKGFDGLQRVN